MNKYNLKVKQYPFGQQIRIYKNPVLTSQEPRKKKQKNHNETIDAQKSLETSISRAKQKILDLLLCNDWEYFVTFTFNPEIVDSFDYQKCSKCLTVYLKNSRLRKSPNMQYVGVPELHKSGRYHYHFLMSNISELELKDSGHKDNKGRIVYHLGNYSLGWVTATKITDTKKASSYVMKYITKDLMTKIKHRKMYWRSRNLQEPEVFTDYLFESQKTEYKEIIKERTTSAKVVTIDTSSYKNIIDYIWSDIT